MPYDANVEIDEFRFMDTRERQERLNYQERELPRRRTEPVDRPARETQAEFYARTQPGVYDSEGRRINPLAEVVNNPGVTVTAAEVKAINDPKKRMTPQGRIVKAQSGRDVISRSGQFTNMGIPLPVKRTRKKTKMDRTMSSCLKQANAKARKINGKFKKGWDQARTMSYAHKLCRRENGTKKGMVRKTARRAYKKR